MKVMLRKTSDGRLSLYVPKKDLEEFVVAQERPELWGGSVTLSNGWVMALPDMDAATRLPITVEAKRLSGDE
jgi:nitrogen fixation protein NifT